MITSGNSMLSKVTKEVLSTDFNFSKLISKTTLIFFREINEIIKMSEKFKDELDFSDLISLVENRLKPVVIAFSFMDNSVKVYENDYYEEFLFTILNNKSMKLLNVDLKKIVGREDLSLLLDLDSEERYSELYKVFTLFFENNFSKAVSDVLMLYSNTINNITTSRDDEELTETILDFNDLIDKNSLPLSILTKNELKSYLTFVLSGISEVYIPPFFVSKQYHYLEDKKFKDDMKDLVYEIVFELLESKKLTKATNGFLFMANYRLFVNNGLFFKTLKRLWSLFVELNYTRFDLNYHGYLPQLSDSFFVDVFSDLIDTLTKDECDSAGDLLVFMFEHRIFSGDTSLELITRRLSKKLGELNHKVSIKIHGYLFNGYSDKFIYDLFASKSINEMELQFESYNIISLFQTFDQTRMNALLDLIDLNGIKIVLNQECANSLRGLLIGLENGLVISQSENNKANLERFLSLME